MSIDPRRSLLLIGLTMLSVAGLALAACGTRPAPLPPIPVPTQPPVTAAPPTVLPTLAPTLEPTAEPAPDLAQALAALPGNTATGEPAPDFTLRTLGGGSFKLSDYRGSPVLMIFTAAGYGECFFESANLGEAYDPYRGAGLVPVMVNVVLGDTDQSWEPVVTWVDEPEFIWGFDDTATATQDYNVKSLDVTVLVDPVGRVIYRGDWPTEIGVFHYLLAALFPEVAGPPPSDPAEIFAPSAEATVPPALAYLADLPGNFATGELAADFTVQTLAGGTFTLSDQRGAPVLILFTAACDTCLDEARMLAEVYPRYRDRGLKVVILDFVWGDDEAGMQPYIAQIAEPDFIWASDDEYGTVSTMYEVPVIDTTVLVDREGRIVYRDDWTTTRAQFEQLVARLFP